MSFLNKRIGSHQTQHWLFTLLLSLVVFWGLESLVFLTGIYQMTTFLTVSAFLYAFLIVYATLIFDLRLKTPKSWSRSKEYYSLSKHRYTKWWRIFWRAASQRFRYLANWQHWLHFQNYLILPAILYWALVMLIFLNPFALWTKQAFVICGTLLLTAVMWYLKTVFFNYSGVNWSIKNLMFTIHVVVAFLVFSGLLGVVWYFGLRSYNFIGGCAALSFLLMYQALFRLREISFTNILRVVGGSLIIAICSAIVYKFWAVNFYTAGLALANVLNFYWGLTRLQLKHRLTKRLVIEHFLIFVFVLLFVMATTNFQARVG